MAHAAITQQSRTTVPAVAVPVVFGMLDGNFLYLFFISFTPANICFNTYAQMSLQGAIFMLLRLSVDVAAFAVPVAVAVAIAACQYLLCAPVGATCCRERPS